MKKDLELIERVAKALFQQADQGEAHFEPDERWEALLEVSVLGPDKVYYRSLAEKVIYPDV